MLLHIHRAHKAEKVETVRLPCQIRDLSGEHILGTVGFKRKLFSLQVSRYFEKDEKHGKMADG